jgi:uncharacterized protein
MHRILIVGGLVGGLAATALFAGVGAPEPAQGDTAPARTVTVSGVGTVEAVPDEASFSFGVETEAPTAREASTENAAAMRRLIEALRAAGVGADDMQTQHVSVWPTGERGDTYQASNSVSVTTSVDRAGALVEIATRAGANTVNGPSLTRSESHELEAQALERALADARRKAEVLAAATGAEVGVVVRVVEGSSPQPYPEFAHRAALSAADAAPPIEPGKVPTTATLTVTFELQ